MVTAKNINQTILWLSSSHSDWHALQRRLQPTPTTVQINRFTASVPTEPNQYIYIYTYIYTYVPTYILNEDTQPVIRAIGVSHRASKHEFRQSV